MQIWGEKMDFMKDMSDDFNEIFSTIAIPIYESDELKTNETYINDKDKDSKP